MRVRVEEEYAGEFREKAGELAARIEKAARPRARKFREPALRDAEDRVGSAYRAMLVRLRVDVDAVVARRRD